MVIQYVSGWSLTHYVSGPVDTNTTCRSLPVYMCNITLKKLTVYISRQKHSGQINPNFQNFHRDATSRYIIYEEHSYSLLYCLFSVQTELFANSAYVCTYGQALSKKTSYGTYYSVYQYYTVSSVSKGTAHQYYHCSIH